jgi:hypothetical protein
MQVSQESDTQFIKARGISAAFSQPQTWLLEYDLNSRGQIGRNRVDPSVLPEECQIKRLRLNLNLSLDGLLAYDRQPADYPSLTIPRGH